MDEDDCHDDDDDDENRPTAKYKMLFKLCMRATIFLQEVGAGAEEGCGCGCRVLCSLTRLHVESKDMYRVQSTLLTNTSPRH